MGFWILDEKTGLGDRSECRRVLLISNSPVGEKMSGPGIRYWEFARVLSQEFDVTLAVPPGVPAQLPDGSGDLAFRFQTCRDEVTMRRLASEAEVLIAPGALLALYPSLMKVHTPLVLDLYIPLLLEELQRESTLPLPEQSLFYARLRRAHNTQVLAADLILCASERQRDYWLGVMSALGRVNPYTHADDPSLRRLIAVVPFGLPSEPPRHTRPVLREVYPGIARSDRVLLWGGSIWDWLDAPTLIRAMARLADQRPDIKLFFMGVKHSNPQELKRKVLRETLALSQELGLTGRTVFFNDWVAYEDRANYLLEADIGVSLHRDHLEARFSFRTRFLDNLWAGLPIIATRGDVLSEQVEAHGLGWVVEPGDVDGVVEAILSLVDTPDLREVYRPRFERAAADYRWEVVTRPLVEFCAAPRIAPDRAYLRETAAFETGPTPWWRLPGRAWRALRLGGVRGLARQVDEYRRWLLQRRGRG